MTSNEDKPLVSICIPCYEMKGRGIVFLKDLLESITQQTYSNIEIVISDHSENNDIENWLLSLIPDIRSKKIGIEYYRLEDKRGCASANINNAIRMCSGSIVKIMFQDDIFVHQEAISVIVEAFEKNPTMNWGAQGFIHFDEKNTKFEHEQIPRFNNEMLIGINTIGCPSVIFFRNTSDSFFFDDNLCWLMDVEYYHNLAIHFGKPLIIDKITVGIRIWKNSVTNHISEIIKLGEEAYCLRKYRQTKETLKNLVI